MRSEVLNPYIPWTVTGHAGGQFLLPWARSLCERRVDVMVVGPNHITSRPDTFAEMVLACLKDAARAEGIGRQPLHGLDQTFNWNRSVDETLNGYRLFAEVTV